MFKTKIRPDREDEDYLVHDDKSRSGSRQNDIAELARDFDAHYGSCQLVQKAKIPIFINPFDRRRFLNKIVELR